MKLMKRLAGILLAVCLVVPFTRLYVNAADGVIFFTDLDGIQVGETFTIQGSVVNRDGNLGQVEQKGAEVTDANGETLNLLDPPGYSNVKIEAGDGTQSSSGTATGSKVTLNVNDTEYTVASSFPSNELPAGFSAADITVNGETVKGAVKENGNVQLLYLLDSGNVGAFFLYHSDCESCLWRFFDSSGRQRGCDASCKIPGSRAGAFRYSDSSCMAGQQEQQILSYEWFEC